MLEAFRRAPNFQIDMLGYFLYSRVVEDGLKGTPELCATRCLMRLPWPAQALGDDTCALDLMPRSQLALSAMRLLPRQPLALDDAPPAMFSKRRRRNAGSAAVGS